MILPFRIAALVFGSVMALWWIGFLSPDTMTFDLPAGEVEARLSHASLPPGVFGEEPPNTSVRSEPGRVSWLISQNGSEMMRYVVDISPAGPTRSRVHVALRGPVEGPFGNVDERIRSDHTLRNLYVTAMKEQVHAVLENRHFRYSAIYGATTAATTAHLQEISSWMDRAGEAHNARERNNMEEAYRDAGLD